TVELRLGRPITFIDTATCRTGTRRVAGIDIDDFDAGLSCFVTDLLLQIVKRPAMQDGSLGLLNRYPVADALEVFQGDAALSALSLCHDAFADAMVGVARKTMFLTGQALQAPFGRFGAFLLQLATQATVAVADVVDGVGAVDFAIAVGGEVDNAAINP